MREARYRPAQEQEERTHLVEAQAFVDASLRDEILKKERGE